jgi:hypothetical protein
LNSLFPKRERPDRQKHNGVQSQFLRSFPDDFLSVRLIQFFPSPKIAADTYQNDYTRKSRFAKVPHQKNQPVCGWFVLLYLENPVSVIWPSDGTPWIG